MVKSTHKKNQRKHPIVVLWLQQFHFFFSIPLIVIYRRVFYRFHVNKHKHTVCVPIYTKNATIETFYGHISDLREFFFIVFRHSNSVLSIWCSFKGCLSPLGWLRKQNETKHTTTTKKATQQCLHISVTPSLYEICKNVPQNTTFSSLNITCCTWCYCCCWLASLILAVNIFPLLEHA